MGATLETYRRDSRGCSARTSVAHPLDGQRRNQAGASVIIALLLFMVCATVAAIIVGSASTSVERTQQHATEERGYFAVSSALRQGQIAFETYKPTAELDSSDDEIAIKFKKPSVTSGQWSEALQNWLCSELEDKLKGTSYAPASFTTDVTVEGQPGEALPTVKLTYTMAGNYKGGCDVTISAAEKAAGTDKIADYGKTLSAKYTYKAKAASESSDKVDAYWVDQLLEEDTSTATPVTGGPRNGYCLTEEEFKYVILYGGWGNNSTRYTWVWSTYTDPGQTGDDHSCLLARNTGGTQAWVGLVYYKGVFYRAYQEAEGDGKPDTPIPLADNFKVSDLVDGQHHTDGNGRDITWRVVK